MTDPSDTSKKLPENKATEIKSQPLKYNLRPFKWSNIGWMIRVRFPLGPGIFLFANTSRQVLGPTQPPTQWVPGDTPPWVKRPEREDH